MSKLKQPNLERISNKIHKLLEQGLIALDTQKYTERNTSLWDWLSHSLIVMFELQWSFFQLLVTTCLILIIEICVFPLQVCIKVFQRVFIQ